MYARRASLSSIRYSDGTARYNAFNVKDRSLLYETLKGQRRMEITSGVAQGSILGPDLWNASYDSLVRLDMPEESRLIGYADDVAALVAGRTVEQAQSRLVILMRRVSGWITAHGFNLALEKTEVVILTRGESRPCVPYRSAS